MTNNEITPRDPMISPEALALLGGAYLLVAILHAAFDSLNGILGYVVIALLGLIPLVWMWRAGKREGVAPKASYLG